MGRNVNSFFSETPATVDMRRSRFERPQDILTTFNCGDVIPFYVDTDILPGDTVSIDTSKVVRLSTLITPMFGNVWLDTYYFFIPHRLVWEHWKNFMGESDRAWLPSVTYTVPQTTAPSGGWQCGTIADYMGIPTGVDNFSVDSLAFRAYALTMNEWFRSEVVTDPINVYTGDATSTGSNGSTYYNDVPLGGMPFKAAKFADYFSTATVSPQKGPDVPLPLGQYAPVYSSSGVDTTSYGNAAVRMKFVDGTNLSSGIHNVGILGNASDTGWLNANVNTSGSISDYKGAFFSNLAADLTRATGTSINQLREAFQIQKLYERDAIAGSRYTEVIKAHFNVSSPDSRLQRPEYLGGTRVPINVHQVVQSSATDSVSPQGTTTAYSLTIDSNSDFTKSFTEHGTLLGVCVARYNHTYQQGLERMWSRRLREDWYWPEFSNLGEQEIRNKELFLTGTATDDQVFGYQERFAEYRYKPNRISGMFRSNYTTPLDFWHLGDDYASLPQLSDAWLREDKSNIDRVLTVTSAISHQFIADIYVKATYVRVMPLYSVPGLIDHH